MQKFWSSYNAVVQWIQRDMVGYSKVWFSNSLHDDVIKWKHFPRYWPFLRGIPGHRWLPRTKASDASFDVFFDLRWLNGWVNKREPGDLRHHRAHYDVTVMIHHCNMGTGWKTAARWLPQNLIKSLRPSDAYMRRWTGSSSVQIMACRLFGAKPLSEPMLEYC